MGGRSPGWVCLRARLHQAIVLTHEGVGDESAAPYLSCALRPLHCAEFLGRSRAMQPPCPRDHATFYFWKEWAWWKGEREVRGGKAGS
jgi:hypothetical protein